MKKEEKKDVYPKVIYLDSGSLDDMYYVLLDKDEDKDAFLNGEEEIVVAEYKFVGLKTLSVNTTYDLKDVK